MHVARAWQMDRQHTAHRFAQAGLRGEHAEAERHRDPQATQVHTELLVLCTCDLDTQTNTETLTQGASACVDAYTWVHTGCLTCPTLLLAPWTLSQLPQSTGRGRHGSVACIWLWAIPACREGTRSV